MIVRAFIKGLEDYSTDQRGDVGSWVRIASLDSIGRVLASLSPPSPLSSIVEPGIYDEVIGGLVKQGVEKLESVRSASALALARMRECGWWWDTQGAMSVSRKQLDEEGFRYVDQEEWFQSAMPLLETRFRKELVTGLTFTIGSQVVTLVSIVALYAPQLLTITCLVKRCPTPFYRIPDSPHFNHCSRSANASKSYGRQLQLKPDIHTHTTNIA